MMSTVPMRQPENWLYEIWQKGYDSPCYVMVPNAKDLVKSHLMIAVREEVEVLKERISELMDKINQLEVENTILKANISQETLQQLQLQTQLQIAGSASSTAAAAGNNMLTAPPTIGGTATAAAATATVTTTAAQSAGGAAAATTATQMNTANPNVSEATVVENVNSTATVNVNNGITSATANANTTAAAANDANATTTTPTAIAIGGTGTTTAATATAISTSSSSVSNNATNGPMP